MTVDFPTVPAYRRLLASCNTDLGNALSESRPDESETCHRQALAIWKKVREEFPNEPEDRSGVAFSRHWLGKVLMEQRRYPEAEAELRLTATMRAQLLAEQPQNVQLKIQLAHVQDYLAGALLCLARPQEAEPIARQAIAIAETLVEDFPELPEHRRKLGDYYGRLSEALWELGRTQEAEEVLRKSLAVRTKLLAEFPELHPLPSSVAWNYYELGLLLQDTGRPAEAAEEFRLAKKFFEEIAARNPDVPLRVRALAWFLTDCPAVQFRDPDRAVELAKKCLQHAPLLRSSWKTLGFAQYRAGQWRAAVESIGKSMELGSGGDSSDWLCLAMAHWQLGEKDEAHKWLEKATESIDKDKRNGEALHRYRRDAEELLGLKKRD
jgi:tetratricopeptide (TPR) repeat protein